MNTDIFSRVLTKNQIIAIELINRLIWGRKMKLTNTILASAMALALTGCGSSDDNDTETSDIESPITTDIESPIITLIGATTVNLTQGETYTDAGVTISDNVDINLVATVAGDTVDTSVNGTYLITYNVSDDAGNAATEVTRTVNVTAADVSDTQAPIITLNPTFRTIFRNKFFDRCFPCN